jgi:septal ring factor EnvC (AmiA/AmiB activator)
MDEKLQDSEESAKQFQQQLLELKIHSSKLQKSLAAFQHKNCKLNYLLGYTSFSLKNL